MSAPDVVTAYLGKRPCLRCATCDVALRRRAGAVGRVARRRAPASCVCVVGPERRRQDDADQHARRHACASRAGRIAIDGHDITRAAAASLLRRRHRASFRKAGGCSPRMTVRENLELGSYLPPARAAARASLDARAARCSRRCATSSHSAAGDAVGRPAADGGDRPRADGAAAAAAARRAVARALAADRRTTMFDAIRAGSRRGHGGAAGRAERRDGARRRRSRLRARGRPHRRRGRARRLLRRGPRSSAPTSASDDRPFRGDLVHAVPNDHRRQLPAAGVADRSRQARRAVPAARAREGALAHPPEHTSPKRRTTRR